MYVKVSDCQLVVYTDPVVSPSSTEIQVIDQRRVVYWSREISGVSHVWC